MPMPCELGFYCLKAKTITYPRTGIADIEVISTLLGRKLGSGFFGDCVTEYGSRALEVARFVGEALPVGSDIAIGLFLSYEYQQFSLYTGYVQ